MKPTIDLLVDEEIVFEDDLVVVTNRRLIGNFDTSEDGLDAVELRVVGAPRQFNGGYESKRTAALQLLAGGVAVVLIGAFAEGRGMFPDLVAALIFVVGATAAMVGLYLLVNSLFRRPPNTTVIFPVFEGPDVIASYPDRDNPQADQLVTAFARAKRRMAL